MNPDFRRWPDTAPQNPSPTPRSTGQIRGLLQATGFDEHKSNFLLMISDITRLLDAPQREGVARILFDQTLTQEQYELIIESITSFTINK
jgi:hypothetical protein